ncbi:MAG: hypothetical protein J1F38_05260 [Muribaculaceae bacterium]|nr:hypothetical protein [Muribaculaceae bacterium]
MSSICNELIGHADGKHHLMAFFCLPSFRCKFPLSTSGLRERPATS